VSLLKLLATIMTSQTAAAFTFVLMVRIPAEGIGAFRAYEDAVLPLLLEFGGRLERRLRNTDGTIETHIVSFVSEDGFENYRGDPRRAAQMHLLKKSGATFELCAVVDVS
jgi:hypothetical protein